MKTIPYPMRIPKEILVLSRLRANEEHLDQTTALRQFLHLGAEEYVLKLVERGRISIGKAAELLKKTIYELQEAAKKHGIQLGASQEQIKKSKETAKKMFLTHSF